MLVPVFFLIYIFKLVDELSNLNKSENVHYHLYFKNTLVYQSTKKLKLWVFRVTLTVGKKSIVYLPSTPIFHPTSSSYFSSHIICCKSKNALYFYLKLWL